MPGHQIPLATFVRTSEQTEALILSLNKELFDGQLQFELVVLPAEEGSFLTRLGLIVAAGWAGVWTFTESDIGKAFMKGLTDHEPAYWAEMAGKTVKVAIEDFAETDDVEIAKSVSDCDVAAKIVATTATSFLQVPNAKLEHVGITSGRFRAAYEAKNAFYDACTATPKLRAIGFNESPEFPISRDDFSRLQVILPPKEDELDHPWFVATVLLKVTSPNWDRDDRSRHWKGKDAQGRDRYFRIEDEEFWARVSAETISIHIIDTMRVQLAFQGRLEQPKNSRVMRVLEFNGVDLAQPLSDEALFANLGRLEELSHDQGDLFEH